MKGAFWDPEGDFQGRRTLGGLLGEPYYAHTGGAAGSARRARNKVPRRARAVKFQYKYSLGVL
jgi:hypothetical protein